MKLRYMFALTILSFFIAILLSSTAEAKEYDPFTNVSVGDDDLYLSIEPDSDTLLGILYHDSRKDILIFGPGDCEIHSDYEICFNGAVLNVSGEKYYARDNKIYPLVDLTVDKLESKIKITKTVDRSTALVGDKVKVDIRIENQGSQDIEDVVYTEFIDEESFEYGSHSQYFRKSAGKYLWTGKIRSNDIRELYYVLSSEKIQKYTTDSEISYRFLDEEMKSASISEKTVSFEDNYFYDISFKDDKINIGENGRFEFYINNKDERSTLKISKLDIYFDEYATNISENDFDRKVDHYSLSAEEIPALTKDTFFINFTPVIGGNRTIKYELIATLGPKSIEDKGELEYKTVSEGLSGSFDIEKDEFEYNEKGKVHVILKNEDKKATYHDVYCNATIYDYLDFDFDYDSIKPGQEIKHYIGYYNGQKFDRDRNVRLYLKCTYNNVFGKETDLVADDFVKVKQYESDYVDIGSSDIEVEDPSANNDGDVNGTADDMNLSENSSNENDDTVITYDNSDLKESEKELRNTGIISSIVILINSILG